MYRLATMVQMVGVIILALAIPRFFASVEHGERLANELLVAGYVIMRIALVAQWLRAARQDPAHRSACLTYAAVIAAVQVGWIATIFLPLSVIPGLIVFALLGMVEMAGPWFAERRRGATPWHSHHIAERYGLLTIIALGEGVVGTVVSLAAIVKESGWTADAVYLVVAGTGLTFSLWWIYFAVPVAELLHAQRERSFIFGYLHIPLYAAIVATGAGLHSAEFFIEGHSVIGSIGTVFSVVIPVGVFVVLVCGLYSLMVRRLDAFHVVMVVLTALVLAGAVVAAAAGLPMAACLLIATAAPVLTVVGIELVGHRRMSAAVESAVSGPDDG